MKTIIQTLDKNLSKTNDFNTFIQIGANCGDDEFTQLCKKYKPKQIILIEPHIRYNESLKQCYSGLNYVIENVVITTNPNINKATLYFPDSEQTRAQHSTLVPLNDWLGHCYPCSQIPASTFSNILNKYNIIDIDLLMVDTEGMDYSIINSIDLEKTNIHNIVYESWKFPRESCYDKNHQNLFGTNGLNFINNKLTTLGYTIINDSEDYYATKE